MLKLREADRVEILSLMDNSVDFLSVVNNEEVSSFRHWTRYRYGKEWTTNHHELPFAEHGFSMLVHIFSGGKSRCVLFDTGNSPNGVIENSRRMGLDLGEIESIVLSHGHYDHSGGLLSVLDVINRVDLPLIVHDDAFANRGLANKDGSVRPYPEFPSRKLLRSTRLFSTKQPFAIADGLILVTGEIPRQTEYERGLPEHRAIIHGSWRPDPSIWDDQALVVNVRGKGLVVLAGCAHAGIINTVRYAQTITGVNNVYAVLGGFHLAGKETENRIDQTVKALKEINPILIVPSHCTGRKGMYAIANALPTAFVFNSVGNLYNIRSNSGDAFKKE